MITSDFVMKVNRPIFGQVKTNNDQIVLYKNMKGVELYRLKFLF